jgi:hypothetical protein
VQAVGGAVAFLSTPSIFFSLTDMEMRTKRLAISALKSRAYQPTDSRNPPLRLFAPPPPPLPPPYAPAMSSPLAHSRVFDLDPAFSKDPGYVRFDFNTPEALPADLHGTFDLVHPPALAYPVLHLIPHHTRHQPVRGAVPLPSSPS